jgi:S-adenosylmethionine:tRNA ribosyltransferase-isomerase
MDFSEYDYQLPLDRIALEPVSPRDESKLMVYDTVTDEISFDRFRNISKYLPKHSVLVLNDTKVLPVRVLLKKQRGKPADIMFLLNEPAKFPGLFKAIANRHLPLGQKLFFDEHFSFTIDRQEERFFYLKPHFPGVEFSAFLEKAGRMPLPHYLEASPMSEQERRERYQTVFAEHPGSVAAPTASLHFTPGVLKEIGMHADVLHITHHVGLATFTTVLQENVKDKKLLEEWYEIGADAAKTLQGAKRDKRPIVAVGTTATRALESFFCSGKRQGNTDLFIFPPYEFQAIDGLITNFHLPKSSLMMLVEAFLQHKKASRHLKELYEIAIRENFRFYSFGDAMLVV